MISKKNQSENIFSLYLPYLYRYARIQTINYNLPNKIKFVGYIDVLIYDTVREKYKIIDIKTSTRGWNKWQKRDENKTQQLLLYKAQIKNTTLQYKNSFREK